MAFQKVEKIEVFDDHRPVEKVNFCYFPILHISHPNEWIFIFESTTRFLSKNGQFCYFHIFAYFSSKSIKVYILVVLC